MGILFAISIAALLALLWAAFQTARHIRRARRRQRNAVEAVLKVKTEVADDAKSVTAVSTEQDAATLISNAEHTGQGVAPATGDWTQLGYNRSGIIGNSFTGTSPKI